MKFDPLYSPFPSRRRPLCARGGMVATSQAAAAQAGLRVLERGGNAVDAAIATAACLVVAEPTSNGVGGDNFALVWSGGRLHGLNASGPAPASISIGALAERGHKAMPLRGWTPVTVPGAPGGWAELSARFGRLPFRDLLRGAVAMAREGYPVAPVLAKDWAAAYRLYRAGPEGLTAEELEPWFRAFAPEGRAPVAGELWKCPELADTLEVIGETGAEDFYRGRLADQIDAEARKRGGFLRKSDLEAFRPEWVEPITVPYRGYDVWEIPPNGQGIAALMALNILSGFEFSHRDDPLAVHRQIEAMKLAFVDAKRYVTDPAHMEAEVRHLLSPAYAEERRALISPEAMVPAPGRPPAGGTVYLCTADREGTMVSMIQSNYKGWGSGIVVPGTGIALQNRGYDFSLDPAAPNALAGGKRTYHTIIPGFLTKDGAAVGPFGVMGEYMQPQGHVQVVMNTVDFALNPQAALDAPRWQWLEGRGISLEGDFPDHIARALDRMGHEIARPADDVSFGRGQIIWRDSGTGVLWGGTEKRADGAVVGYS